MNSVQLHYREATRALQAARDGLGGTPDQQLTVAQVHATLALTAAIAEMTKQAHPDTDDAVARAVGVYRNTPDNVVRPHAWDAF